MNRSPPYRQWDIFCTVIDNFGDIGVCWRLAADLASRGQRVRLWLDDTRALRWMAPDGCAGVDVLPWPAAPALLGAEALKKLDEFPSDVLIEAFGCEPAPEFIAVCARTAGASGEKPVWINLEYLTAEAYASRNHQLPSPVQGGPAAGWRKTFFYPGFISDTGGLLREPNLVSRRSAFDRDSWLRNRGIDIAGAFLVSLFCYEPPVLGRWLAGLASHGMRGQPIQLLVTAGRAQAAVRAALAGEKSPKYDKNESACASGINSLLSISYLPALSQDAYDELLWACDLNFVRGEDSLVRAVWAGKPFVWQIYPQEDGAHHGKLDAFLDMLQAPKALRDFHRTWNAGAGDLAAGLEPSAFADCLQAWQQEAPGLVLARLAGQPDLTRKLLEFVQKNR